MDRNDVVTAHISNTTSHISASCLLCGGPAPVPFLGTPAICDECKRKWNKLSKMIDAIEVLTEDVKYN